MTKTGAMTVGIERDEAWKRTARIHCSAMDPGDFFCFHEVSKGSTYRLMLRTP